MLSGVQNIFGTNPYQQIEYSSVPKTVTDNNFTNKLTFQQALQIDTTNFNLTAEDICRKKFDSLFPNGELNKIYEKINNDFGVDTPASLNFIYDPTSQKGGGYTFVTNSIDMNIFDLMSSNKKIVGIDANGEKHTLISPKEKLPLFVDEKSAKQFVEMHNQNGFLGYQKLIIEEVTAEEQKKFITQKIAHECIHARQHQDIRETEGIDDKAIIRAWTHKKPKNLIDAYKLNQYVETAYEKSPWSKLPKPEKKYQKGSDGYKLAMIYLYAIQNYPPITSPEYVINPLEREAYDLSYKYVNA